MSPALVKGIIGYSRAVADTPESDTGCLKAGVAEQSLGVRWRSIPNKITAKIRKMHHNSLSRFSSSDVGLTQLIYVLLREREGFSDAAAGEGEEDDEGSQLGGSNGNNAIEPSFIRYRENTLGIRRPLESLNSNRSQWGIDRAVKATRFPPRIELACRFCGFLLVDFI